MTVASAVGQVQENSPAQQAGLEPYFDFIITIGHSRLVRLHDPATAVHILAWGRPPTRAACCEWRPCSSSCPTWGPWSQCAVPTE